MSNAKKKNLCYVNENENENTMTMTRGIECAATHPNGTAIPSASVHTSHHIGFQQIRFRDSIRFCRPALLFTSIPKFINIFILTVQTFLSGASSFLLSVALSLSLPVSLLLRICVMCTSEQTITVAFFCTSSFHIQHIHIYTLRGRDICIDTCIHACGNNKRFAIFQIYTLHARWDDSGARVYYVSKIE